MKRILLVEDEAAEREILTLVLTKRAGFEVDSAADGDEAMRLYSEHGPLTTSS